MSSKERRQPPLRRDPEIPRSRDPGIPGFPGISPGSWDLGISLGSRDLTTIERRAEVLDSPAPRCWLRLAQQGLGAVRNPLVGLSVPMLARYSQRESVRGPTGPIVYRRRVTICIASAFHRSHRRKGRRRPIRHSFPLWWPPSPPSGGSEKPKNGSWRSRWPSLRPDGAWTVPRSAGTDFPGQERG